MRAADDGCHEHHRQGRGGRGQRRRRRRGRPRRTGRRRERAHGVLGPHRRRPRARLLRPRRLAGRGAGNRRQRYRGREDVRRGGVRRRARGPHGGVRRGGRRRHGGRHRDAALDELRGRGEHERHEPRGLVRRGRGPRELAVPHRPRLRPLQHRRDHGRVLQARRRPREPRPAAQLRAELGSHVRPLQGDLRQLRGRAQGQRQRRVHEGHAGGHSRRGRARRGHLRHVEHVRVPAVQHAGGVERRERELPHRVRWLQDLALQRAVLRLPGQQHRVRAQVHREAHAGKRRRVVLPAHGHRARAERRGRRVRPHREGSRRVREVQRHEGRRAGGRRLHRRSGHVLGPAQRRHGMGRARRRDEGRLDADRLPHGRRAQDGLLRPAA